MSTPFLPSNLTADTFVVCWSHEQNLFHIETIEEFLVTGQRAFMAKVTPSYIPIAMFNDRTQASEHCDFLRESGSVPPIK